MTELDLELEIRTRVEIPLVTRRTDYRLGFIPILNAFMKEKEMREERKKKKKDPN